MDGMVDATVTLIRNSVPSTTTAATTSATTSYATSSSFSSSTIFTNYPLISAVLAFALAQSFKLFTSWYLKYPILHLITILLNDPFLVIEFVFCIIS